MAGAGNATSSVALVRRGVLQQSLGATDDAVKDFRAAIAVNPNDPDAQNDLAFTLADAHRDLDDALAAAQKAVALAPKVALYSDTLAWVDRARGDLPAALEILKPLAVVAVNPDIPYHLGMIYRGLGRPQEATSAFNAALRIDPKYQPALEAMR